MRGVSAARACALNAGIQLVWGALLGLSLQSRTIALAPASTAISTYAYIFAAGALVATAVQIVAGIVSDRQRRARGAVRRLAFYVAGTALAIPALFWFYLTPDLVQLTAAFIAVELGMNVLCGPYQAVIPDYVPAGRRGLASSWMSAYQAIGNALGLVTASFVHDLRAVAAALGAFLAASCAVSVTHLRGVPGLDDEPAVVASIERLPAWKSPLAALLLSRGLINGGFFTLLGFLLFFVRDSLHVGGDATILETGYLFLTFTLCALPGAALAARPADRYDKRLTVSISVGAVALALAGLALANTFPLALAASAVAGIGWGAFVTTDWALASVVLPPQALATSMGVWNIATTIPQVIAPLVTAPLVTRFGATHASAGPRAAIILALIEFIAGGAAIWRLPRA